MIKYKLKQCKNKQSKVFGKWLAYPVIEQTLDLDALAKHMSEHNTPYSEGVIRGVFTDMVKCIKEQLLEGKNVKIDDLAIFSVGIKNSKGGADSEEDFSVSKNICYVKLRARATGELATKALNPEATLRKANSQGTTGGGATGGGTTESTGNGSTDPNTPNNPINPNNPTDNGDEN